ncbi:MAG TPA: hypothetical protein VEY12_12570 [Thermoplasmata archaeon]|nr:hypothetical protein [Thermoplasmata archaeon]
MLRAEANPHGDGGGEALRTLGLDAGDPAVVVRDVLERFQRNTVTRFKPTASTPMSYTWMFRRFADQVRLDKYTRKQLAGPKGRELLLAHLASVPLKSRRVTLSGLQVVWEEGLNLPWPISRKRDFGRTLPPAGRRQTPPDADIKAWAEAVRNEKDPYLKFLVLCVLQNGWRPGNQVAHLSWKHVRYDDQGKPYAIIADGTEADFKSSSPIIAWLFPDVLEAMESWRNVSPATSPEDPILPWRGMKGQYVVDDMPDSKRTRPGTRLDGPTVRDHFHAFAAKWSLPDLSPVYFRHAVKTLCRRAGLGDPESNALVGHGLSREAGMTAVYDNPMTQAILDEQRNRIPHGPLGVLMPPEVHLVEGPEREATSVLAEYFAGKVGLMELMQRIESMKRKVDVIATR